MKFIKFPTDVETVNYVARFGLTNLVESFATTSLSSTIICSREIMGA